VNIPTFSLFSATSELFVTAIVLYTVITNLRGKPLRWKLLGGCLLFELCINVMYMVYRSAPIDTSAELAASLRLLFMVHGILSLVMFVALVLLYVVSTIDHKLGRPTWFRRHTVGTWAFLGLWLLSVGSGEAAFIWRYFPGA
jgi:hypothetical protein